MKKILLVDDEEMILEPIELCFNRELEGVKVHKAYNGQEGLEIFDLENPDIVVTDYSMPLLTGVDFAKYIRQKNIEIPIILVTGYFDDLEVDQIDLFSKVISKPFDLKVLTDLIKKYLNSNTPVIEEII